MIVSFTDHYQFTPTIPAKPRRLHYHSLGTAADSV